AGARLGVPRKGFFGVNRGIDLLMTGVLDKLKSLGAELVDPADLEIPPDLGLAEIDVFLGEMQAGMAAYLKRRPDAKVKTLADLVALNKQHADQEMKFYGQEYFEQSVAKPGMADKAYLDARAKCLKIVREQLLDKVMADKKLDGFVAVTN